MKQFFFFLGAIVLSLVACEKSDSREEEEPDQLSLNIEDRLFDTEAAGNSFYTLDLKEVIVSTDAVSWTVSVDYGIVSDTGWLHVKPAAGISGTSIRILADTNRYLDRREATLVFRSGKAPYAVLKELTVKVDPYLFAEMPAFVRLSASAQDSTIGLYTNATSWISTIDVEWLQLKEKEASSSFYKSLLLSVEKNSGSSSRKGKIQFVFQFGDRWEYGELLVEQGGL